MLTSLSVYNKTLDYVKTFAKFNTTDSASAVREYVVHHSGKRVILIHFHFSPLLAQLHRTLRRESELTQFETAQIANLCPADAEEAKSIVPRYRPISFTFSSSHNPDQLCLEFGVSIVL